MLEWSGLVDMVGESAGRGFQRAWVVVVLSPGCLCLWPMTINSASSLYDVEARRLQCCFLSGGKTELDVPPANARCGLEGFRPESLVSAFFRYDGRW